MKAYGEVIEVIKTQRWKTCMDPVNIFDTEMRVVLDVQYHCSVPKAIRTHTEGNLQRRVPKLSRAAVVEFVAPGCLCILRSIATKE